VANRISPLLVKSYDDVRLVDCCRCARPLLAEGHEPSRDVLQQFLRTTLPAPVGCTTPDGRKLCRRCLTGRNGKGVVQ